jgi:hypothetical protein
VSWRYEPKAPGRLTAGLRLDRVLEVWNSRIGLAFAFFQRNCDRSVVSIPASSADLANLSWQGIPAAPLSGNWTATTRGDARLSKPSLGLRKTLEYPSTKGNSCLTELPRRRLHQF